MNIEFEEFGSEQIETVKEIFKKEGWEAYLKDDDKLKRTFDNSLYLLGAFTKDKLIGFVRVVGDGEHVVLVQDLIVNADYQKKGIGRELFKRIWDKYDKVRMFHVITDIEDEVANHFYQSFGMKPLKEGYMISYFR